MAFFKFRKGAEEPITPPTASESVEAMRKRARHRLIGASVLVMAGVIGFPLVFDSQPRPVAVDIAIEIPDKQDTKPHSAVVSVTPAAQVVVENDAGKDVTPAVPTAPAAPAATASRSVSGALDVAAPPASRPAAKVEPKPAEKKPNEIKKPADEKKPADKLPEPAGVKPPATKLDDGAKAQALLEGRELPAPPASAPAASRFVVQIGAYADAAKAQEVRLKLERAGLKTYTQVVQPKEGKRIRVRVGPFESKAHADKVVERIKKLDLSASILEL